LATYLSAKCPVFVAPAMDLDMYKHPTTKSSLEALTSFGNKIIPATSGELASGLHGEGRMAEPEEIIDFIKKQLLEGLPLAGKKVLITAGPTYEAIDPVRFIGNHSSGLMGFELAKTAANLGADVYLVTGPTHLSINHDKIHVVKVVSADDMYHSAQMYYDNSDIVICAAAVADYRPKYVAEQKIKKADETFTIALVKNKDILMTFGQHKKNQYLVGFALETENEVENAIGKLKRKNLDAIVLNSMQDKGAGFGGSTNKVSFIDTNSTITTFELKTKAEVAVDIFNEIIKRRYA
jgi:phosphopantothenoylcysteine decarboxylase/phosphopantothenate--cysteine ligase